MLNLKKIVIIIPIILAFFTTIFCKIPKNAVENVKFRPPGWVFSVIWPILYILIGLSWYFSIKNNTTIYFIILNLILCSWIIVYGCLQNKLMGLIIILCSIINNIILFFLLYKKNNIVSFFLLIPLFFWLLFAILLNFFEIYFY